MKHKFKNLKLFSQERVLGYVIMLVDVALIIFWP